MKNFVVIGDTHGNHKLIIHRIKSRGMKDMTFMHVGDFGVGFAKESDDKAELLSLNKFLKSRNCHLYVIRGNHDNPIFFNGTYDFSNLHLMPDYSVVEVNGENILMIGGAVSVDRNPRKKSMLEHLKHGIEREIFWHDEGFILDEDKVKNLRGITQVVTHNSPHFTYPINSQSNEYNSHGPFVESFVADDNELKVDLNNERNNITKVWEILKENNQIKNWFYGHFHANNIEEHFGTNFRLLDIGEFYNVVQDYELEGTEFVNEFLSDDVKDKIGAGLNLEESVKAITDDLEKSGVIDNEVNFMLIRKKDGQVKKSKAVRWLSSDGETFEDEPRVGFKLLMSPFNQFFTWLTSNISEIIENSDTVIHFKTGNSEYKLYKGNDEMFDSDGHRESIRKWTQSKS